MNPATYISHSTIRLVCQVGQCSSVGTGFLYQFSFQLAEEKTYVPVIVTNKHVVAGMDVLEFMLTMYPQDAEVDETANGEAHHVFRTDRLQQHIIFHPDPEVDVCIIPLMPLINIPDGYLLRHTFLTDELRLPEQEKVFTRGIEPVVMIGYPNGLWDQVNNRPIARRGLTASHPLRAWNGKRQFVIDSACFPGSSGSPVFLFEDGMFRSSSTSYSPGTRVRLLGLLFAGPVITQEGRLEARSIPTSANSVPVIEGMMNLGFVAHIDTLDDFVPILRPLVERR